jgi:two-component system, cell cycle sensor histidine kinase and response regulator CckA
MNNAFVRVLLVDDDEDDFIITRDLISQIRGHRYQLDWINNYHDAFAAVQRREHDICLLDFRLGERTGLELLRESQSITSRPPIILLTGQGDHEIDLEAMKAGAADYLIKGQLASDQLDRAIRYAIEGKRAEEIMRRERDLISRVMETSPVGIVVADQAGIVTFANHSAEEALDLTKAGIEQKQFSVLQWREADAEGTPIEGRPLPLKLLLETGRPVTDAHHVVELPGPRHVVLSTNATPLFNAAGKGDGMVVTVEDITERLALEAQLRQSQKMELVGRLAAGVAHDINNVLTVIQGHAGILINTAPPNSPALKSLKQIAAASDRAASFVRHLLTFSRKQIVRTKVLDLNIVLQNLKAMLVPMLGEQIVLNLRCEPDLPPVAADAGMTEQIVMNLAVNARDAMPRGGTLTIETSFVEIPVALVRDHPEAHAGEFVCLIVRDTGCGMERRVMQRIFEPFFTTKEVGKGTGLGLATVYGIVKQHQGWIEVESELDVGSAFRVFLPAVERNEESAGSVETSKIEIVRGGKETILMAEDEVNLLGLVSSVLETFEYRVFTAASGAEALAIWEQQRGQIDVLFTDMVMPGGMTGGELAGELKRRKPALKIILTSGYCAEMAGKDLTDSEAVFLPKPYQPQMAAHLIRKILDASAKKTSTGVTSSATARNCEPFAVLD